MRWGLQLVERLNDPKPHWIEVDEGPTGGDLGKHCLSVLRRTRDEHQTLLPMSPTLINQGQDLGKPGPRSRKIKVNI
ncbi:MAG: hypothetical protein ACJAR2_001675 [Ilumatobacter sp.]|jgi:hypothetical protein